MGGQEGGGGYGLADSLTTKLKKKMLCGCKYRLQDGQEVICIQSDPCIVFDSTTLERITLPTNTKTTYVPEHVPLMNALRTREFYLEERKKVLDGKLLKVREEQRAVEREIRQLLEASHKSKKDGR